MPSQKHITIIGGGLGGLVCALVLSKEGFKVSVVEKQKQCGGNLQSFTKNGNVFDTGMHYAGSLDEGQSLNTYFSYLGIMPKLKLKRMDESAFDIIRFQNKEYPFAMSLQLFIDRLLEFFPNEKVGLIKYGKYLQDFWNGFKMLSFNKSSSSESTSQEISLATLLNSITKDETLKQVLAGNHFLYAGHPETTPAYIHAIIQYSFIQSAWKFTDSSNQLAELLTEAIKQNGGEIHTQSEVLVMNVKDSKVISIILKNGEEITSDAFISAIHPSLTMKMIDEGSIRKNYRNRLLDLQNTISSFSVYLIPKKNTFPYLNHNLYIHKGDDIWKDLNISPNPLPSSCMLYTPYNSGSDNYSSSIKIMSYMDINRFSDWNDTHVGKRGDEYEELKHRISEHLIQMACEKYPQLKDNIDFSFASTPLTWRDYTGTPEGAMYGVERNMNASYISSKTKLENLFLTGQNIKLHGALGVTLSAFLTASEFIGFDYLLNKVKHG